MLNSQSLRRGFFMSEPWPQGFKTFLMLINVIMQTIVGILTFIRMINAASDSKKSLYFSAFKFL